MMSRKHYKELAEIMKLLRLQIEVVEAKNAFEVGDKGKLAQIDLQETINELSSFCKRDNPNFQRDKFYKAIFN